MVGSLYGGPGPGLLATFLSSLVIAFFFLPPAYSPSAVVEEILRLGMFVAVALLIVWLAAVRWRAETSLRESEERFRAMADGAPVLLWMASTDAALRTFFNRPWLEFRGRTLEQEMGNGWAEDGVHPEDYRRWMDACSRASDAREEFEIDYRLRRGDGEYRWVLDRGVPRFAPDGGFAGYIGSCVDVTERKEAEEALRESQRRLKVLVGKILVAQEEERRTIAYEVHDGLTQIATATHQHLQAFADDHPAGSKVEEGELDRALELARLTVTEARRLIEDLRPTALDDFGLARALELRIEELQKASWQVGFEEALGEERLPDEVETTLYRVAQEALTNVEKHAGTTRARVALLRPEAGKVRLEVRDEGRGFDPRAALASGDNGGPGERVGLSSMRERVALLGGELKIESQPGAGTRVVAEVPL
jgi:PAS domain S-box-containing protein